MKRIAIQMKFQKIVWMNDEDPSASGLVIRIPLGGLTRKASKDKPRTDKGMKHAMTSPVSSQIAYIR